MNECKHNPIKGRGGIICSECGLELDDRVFHRQTGKINANTGNVISYDYPHKQSFHMTSRTNIGYKYEGKLLVRIRNRDKYANGSHMYITQKFHQINGILNIPRYLHDDIINLYYRVMKNEDVDNRVVLLATCIYDICKSYSIPHINVKNICKGFNIIGSRVGYKLIIQRYIKYTKYMMSNKTVFDRYINYYIDKIISYNGIEDRLIFKGYNLNKEQLRLLLEKEVRNIISHYPKQLHFGANPINLTCCFIYVASRVIAWRFGKKTLLTQKMIGNATGIPEYSIRDIYHKRFRVILKRDGIV